MAVDLASWIAVGLMVGTSTAILINRDWRLSLGALTIQYLAAFWLVTRHLPFVMGSAKLITGWMVVAALGMTRLGLSAEEESERQTALIPRRQWFHVVLMLVVVLAVAGATPRVESAIPGLGLPVVAGSLLLLGAGIIHVSTTSDRLNVIVGLLTMMTGFEILYAAIESSILVTGLLAVTNLGLGLTGSYLLVAGTTPLETEDEL
jgi:hypothetical protein